MSYHCMFNFWGLLGLFIGVQILGPKYCISNCLVIETDSLVKNSFILKAKASIS